MDRHSHSGQFQIVEHGDGIPIWLGMVYLFNIIVAVGALALPAAFAHTGYLVGIGVLCIICLMSYISTTFVIETMSIANALESVARKAHVVTIAHSDIESDSNDNEFPTTNAQSSGFKNVPKSSSQRQSQPNVKTENDPLINSDDGKSLSSGTSTASLIVNQTSITTYSSDTSTSKLFELIQVIECGSLAGRFFSKKGATFFYICLCSYLYGDLAIYAVAISKSTTDLLCDQPLHSNNSIYQNPCWAGHETSQMFIYRISLVVVLVCCGSFAFFNIQKTKYLQIFTTLYRWFAFSMMIVLATLVLIKGTSAGHPIKANFTTIPNLFGASIYAFMCHHSIPSLITPIRNKINLYKFIAIVYVLILCFYLLLSITGVFTFAKLESIYTSNFLLDPIPQLAIIKLLPVYPIFALGTNFPIVALTLSNNLRVLFNTIEDPTSKTNRFTIPLIAICPPIALAMILTNLEFLIGIVGDYSGLFIQWLIPALLVKNARRQVSVNLRKQNKLSSPFASDIWIYIIIVWTLTCTLAITVKRIYDL